MLTINVPALELFNEDTCEFINIPAVTLRMEHSLISISKWESKWQKPFLTKDDKTPDEIAYYYKCMCLDKKDVPDEVFMYMPNNLNKVIWDYINSPMTATTISNRKQRKSSRQIVTSELIYYWMIAYQIPLECEKWHLNRLITLIEICNIKNEPPKKMSSAETMRQNAALNAARRARAHTKG